MFQVGRIYNRRSEIHAPYGGQRQGGISTPRDRPSVFLFTGESGKQYGYRDGWDDNGDSADGSMATGTAAALDHDGAATSA